MKPKGPEGGVPIPDEGVSRPFYDTDAPASGQRSGQKSSEIPVIGALERSEVVLRRLRGRQRA